MTAPLAVHRATARRRCGARVCQRANGGVDRSYLERPVNCESGAQEEARCDESNNSSASNEGGSSSEETIPVGNSNDGPLLRISGIEVGAHDVGNDRDHRGRGGAAASSVARDSERRRRRREMLREMAHNYENAVLSLDAPAQRRHTQPSSERRTISRKCVFSHNSQPRLDVGYTRTSTKENASLLRTLRQSAVARRSGGSAQSGASAVGPARSSALGLARSSALESARSSAVESAWSSAVGSARSSVSHGRTRIS